jgi:hypothetical protein
MCVVHGIPASTYAGWTLVSYELQYQPMDGCKSHLDLPALKPLDRAFYVFYAWWVYFPQLGTLAEGTSI